MGYSKVKARLEFVRRAQLLGFSIYRLAQGFAWLEVGDALFGDGDRLTGAGVAPNTGRPAVHRKAAKTTNLNPVTTHQGIAHRVQNRLDGELCITVCELVELRS
jgi:hypothetical protein